MSSEETWPRSGCGDRMCEQGIPMWQAWQLASLRGSYKGLRGSQDGRVSRGVQAAERPYGHLSEDTSRGVGKMQQVRVFPLVLSTSESGEWFLHFSRHLDSIPGEQSGWNSHMGPVEHLQEHIMQGQNQPDSNPLDFFF